MKKWCLLVVWMLIPVLLPAQDTLRRVYVGTDLLKNVWPLVGIYPDVRSAYTVEPFVSIQLRNPHQYLHVTPGFTKFSSREASSSVLSGRGYYLKVGVERRKRNFGVGLAGLVVAWQDEGTYRFVGSYFGDYIGRIPRQNRVAVGGEFFLSVLVLIKTRLAVRLQPRVTVLAPFTNHADRPDPPFVPGVGLVEGSRWKVSNGLSIQLIYRTSPN